MRTGLIGLLLKLFKKNETAHEAKIDYDHNKSATVGKDHVSSASNLMDQLTGVVLGFCLFIVLMLGLVQILSQTPSYYMMKFDKFGIDQVTHLEKPELQILAKSLSGYLKGTQFDFTAEIKGEEAFNQREKEHMDDVRLLFNKFDDFKRKCGGAAILLLALTMLRYGKWDSLRYAKLLARSSKSMSAFVATFAVFLVVLQFIDFNRYFIMFHKMFFNNDLWQLDPATSLLINLLPEEFFVSFVIDTLLAALAISALLTAMSIFVEKKARRINHVDHH